MRSDNPLRRKLKFAIQAEILRSHQRDVDFTEHLREKLFEILQNFGLHKKWYQYVQLDAPLKLIYFAFTSGMGNQTLGEEYTGIVQANLEQFKVPSLTVRILAIILEIFGERILLKLLRHLQARVNEPDNELTPEAVTFLNIFLFKLRAIVPLFILFHKGIFYIYGRFYSWGRRITSLDYAKVYGQQVVTVSWGLKLLGITTIIQCLLKIWQNDMPQNITTIPNSLNVNHTSHTCQLCLETAATTATLCGHLFCWDCLSNWLRNKPQCPFCREHVLPSRIIHLMNL
ncbi:peroxisome biogenesis factor 10 [Odontomachus brunneus]|uniref:peroxisome biogenesis factor 10 n=1 Tax=Odontomachus brunneus TaxID=486640 RepID=UPI0013F26D74|nr:peroxisome biogenesis factor 10 [Odontomachus brunneus]XP_032690510.1 peroxisome biogenesis factor 10 [Odontomachus brunneus]